MKHLFLLAVFSLSTFVFAQERLVVDYHFTYEFDSTGVTDQKMKDFIKATNESYGDYTLITTKEESSFQKIQKINNAQSLANSSGLEAPDQQLYKNVKENYFLEFIDFNGKKVIIKDSLESFNWVIEKEKTKFLGYEVRKAVFTKDKITYEAWFSPKLAYRSGPEDYAGLPGLILKLTKITTSKDRLNKMHYVATSVRLDDAAKIDQPTKGEVMSRKQFKAFSDAYMKNLLQSEDVETIKL